MKGITWSAKIEEGKYFLLVASFGIIPVVLFLENSAQAACAPVYRGDSTKLVCGDTQDRVVQKWGDPSTTTHNGRWWDFSGCKLEFNSGVLWGYAGNCTPSSLALDSFIPTDMGSFSFPTDCSSIREGTHVDVLVNMVGYPDKADKMGSTIILTYGENEFHETCAIYVMDSKVAFMTGTCPWKCN